MDKIIKCFRNNASLVLIHRTIQGKRFLWRGLDEMKSSVRAVIVEDGNLLFIKLADGLDEGQIHYYVLPGGEAKAIENMFDAIRRHCLNTLNLKVKVHDLLFMRDYKSYQQDGDESYFIRETEHIFLCHIVEKPDDFIHSWIVIKWV